MKYSNRSTISRSVARFILCIPALGALVCCPEIFAGRLFSHPMQSNPLKTSDGETGTAAQSTIPKWQLDAGGHAAFDAASVKKNSAGLPPTGAAPSTNVSLGPGDAYSPNGGLFRAVNMPLSTYISFAYKASATQMLYLRSQLPTWVFSDRFDIEARASGNPTKDQMRLMMQDLLATRFKLKAHSEPRTEPVFFLALQNGGKMGSHLRTHSDEPPCSSVPTRSASGPGIGTTADGFPVICGSVLLMQPTSPGDFRLGGRNVTMSMIADSLAGPTTGIDRAIVNRSAIENTVDFTLEWSLPNNEAQQPNLPSSENDPAATFLQALRDQLDLKLDSGKDEIDVLVVDHIDHPSEN